MEETLMRVFGGFASASPTPTSEFTSLPSQAVADVKVMDREGALKFIQTSGGCLLRDLTAAYPGAPDDVAK